MLFALCSFIEAQQPTKVPRIGYLAPSVSANRISFVQGLRELGYVEGKNIIVEWRANEGKLGRNPALAAELVRLKVDVIVAAGSGEIRAAKEASDAIPIVMVRGGDPVGSGFVASLARPGGNITGLAILRPELSGKRLELLKEIVPKLTRVAVLASSGSADHALVLKEIESAAGPLGLKASNGQHTKFQGFSDPISKRRQRTGRSCPFSGARPLPVFSPSRDCRTRSKEPASGDLRKCAGSRCGRAHIVRGERRRFVSPRRDLRRQNSQRRLTGQLPVEQPTKFELVINLKAGGSRSA